MQSKSLSDKHLQAVHLSDRLRGPRCNAGATVEESRVCWEGRGCNKEKEVGDMPNKDSLKPPKPTVADHAHTMTRMVLGTFIGGPAGELFDALVTPPIERRLQEWREEAVEKLSGPAEQGRIDLEELQRNGSFMDVLLRASRIAACTSAKEKREALRNAILNWALPSPPDEALCQWFLSLIDRYTVWHLRLLAFLDYPARWLDVRGKEVGVADLRHLLLNAFPELVSQQRFYDQVVRELADDGLVNVRSVHTNRSGEVVHAGRHCTDLGRQFLAFVSTPGSC